MKKFSTKTLSGFLIFSVTFLWLEQASGGKFNVKDELHNFDARHYNALSFPEDAHEKLSNHPEFKEFLKESSKIIEEQNLPLGFRLAHKHFSLNENQGMVEYFEENFKLLSNKPALITSPALIDSETYPASWILKDESLGVFEFSKDKEVANVISQIKKKSSTLIELVEIIQSYDLSDLLAISVASRSVVSYFPEPHMLERQFSFGSVVTGESESNISTLGIKTSWGPKRVWCMPESYCHWDNDRQKHFIIVTGHTKVPN